MFESITESIANFIYFLEWYWLPIIKLMNSVLLAVLWSYAVKRWDLRDKDKWKNPWFCPAKRRVPWWAQHTTYLYGQFVLILAAQFITFYHVVQRHRNGNDTVSDFLINTMNDTSSAAHECMSVDFSGTSSSWNALSYLEMFAFSTPIWVLGTFVFCARMTYKHIRQAGEYKPEQHEFTLWNRHSRHRTIWILQLPIVYSITVLFAVQKALHRSRNVHAADLVQSSCNVSANWTDVRALQGFYFESALCFGDAYEGLALLLFASSTVSVIKARVEKVVNQGHEARDNVGDGNSGVVKLKEADETLEKTSEKLAMSMHNLATLGIKYFSFSCFLQAVLPMISCQSFTLSNGLRRVGWQSWAEGFLYASSQTRGLAENMQSWMKGLGFMGSCVAIHNMVLIEQTFHHDFLKDFGAPMKFISVKIMVSIVFIQELVLPMLVGLFYTDRDATFVRERAELLDASLRAFEFFLISIFNQIAWNVTETWYTKDDMKRDWEDVKDVPLLFLDQCSSRSVVE